MASQSKIEWTDCSWQPVTGCSRNCSYCYARRFATRLKAQGHPRYANGFAPTFHSDALAEPLRWRKPRRVFVVSMGDLFDPTITDEQIAAVFGVVAACPQHTFQFLTKCAERLPAWFKWAASLPILLRAKNPAGTCGAAEEAADAFVYRATVEAYRRELNRETEESPCQS